MAALETSNGYTLHCDNADFECCIVRSRCSQSNRHERFSQLCPDDSAAICANSGAYIYVVVTNNA